MKVFQCWFYSLSGCCRGPKWVKSWRKQYIIGYTSGELSEYQSNRQLQLNSLPVNTAGLQTGTEHGPPSPPGVCLKTREYGMEVIYSSSDKDYECGDAKPRLAWRAGIISHLILWIWGFILTETDVFVQKTNQDCEFYFVNIVFYDELTRQLRHG